LGVEGGPARDEPGARLLLPARERSLRGHGREAAERLARADLGAETLAAPRLGDVAEVARPGRDRLDGGVERGRGTVHRARPRSLAGLEEEATPDVLDRAV